MEWENSIFSKIVIIDLRMRLLFKNDVRNGGSVEYVFVGINIILIFVKIERLVILNNCFLFWIVLYFWKVRLIMFVNIG